jgi:outer membrane murein-binding lipoprotein Lpp
MDDLRDRVAALERALSDGQGDLTALAEGAATAERVTELETEVETLREEVDELAAATQALRGYVGNVRSVNESVEERADAAVAAVESLESRVDRLEPTPSGVTQDAPTRVDGDRPETGVPETQSDHCLRCGKPTDASADTPDAVPETGDDDPPGTGVPAASVGGFDPNEAAGRVRVSRDGGTESRAGDGGADDVDEPLVDRVRNLL